MGPALADIASTDQSVAFSALNSLIAPALRRAARHHLSRARHGGKACHGVSGPYLCDLCEEEIHDLTRQVYDRVQAALANGVPTTKAGERIREMDTIRRCMTAPSAKVQRVDDLARLIQVPPRQGDSAEIRAVRAQLVYYPMQHLEERVRRKDAVARGASARPERDLAQSAWAAPLRVNPVALDLLTNAIVKIRYGRRDIYAIPVTLLDRHSLDSVTARRLLADSMALLQSVRREFYLANVAQYLDESGLLPATAVTDLSPEDLLIQDEERDSARAVLITRIAADDAERQLLARVCAAASSTDPDLPAWVAETFDMDSDSAAALIRQVVRLACEADLDWVAEQCRPPMGYRARPSSPRPVRARLV